MKMLLDIALFCWNFWEWLISSQPPRNVLFVQIRELSSSPRALFASIQSRDGMLWPSPPAPIFHEQTKCVGRGKALLKLVPRHVSLLHLLPPILWICWRRENNKGYLFIYFPYTDLCVTLKKTLWIYDATTSSHEARGVSYIRTYTHTYVFYQEQMCIPRKWRVVNSRCLRQGVIQKLGRGSSLEAEDLSLVYFSCQMNHLAVLGGNDGPSRIRPVGGHESQIFSHFTRCNALEQRLKKCQTFHFLLQRGYGTCHELWYLSTLTAILQIHTFQNWINRGCWTYFPKQTGSLYFHTRRFGFSCEARDKGVEGTKFAGGDGWKNWET